MQWRDRLGMYAIVTVVAVLIWLWAAFETRGEDKTLFTIKLQPATDSQVVTPAEVKAEVTFTGSQLALDRARQLASAGSVTMTVGTELPSQTGVHLENLVDMLAANETMADTGVSIVSTEPATATITIDGLVPVTVPVQAVLPGIETEGDPVVEPPQAVMHVPGRLLDRHDIDELAVEAQVLQPRLDRLEPGVQNTLTAKLRLPARFGDDKSIRIEPASATIQFQVKSRIKETTIPTVRVQLAGPAEDHAEYAVEILDRTLADVTIHADVELVRKIERTKEAIVVAVVHLSTKDKENGIESKPVTAFMALPRDENSDVVPTLVRAEINGSDEVPVIRLKITERTTAP